MGRGPHRCWRRAISRGAAILVTLATNCFAEEKAPASPVTSQVEPSASAVLPPAPSAPASEANPDCTPQPPKDYSVAAGLKVGVLMPVGLGAMLSLPGDGPVRWQIDVVWEPSNYLQSYSVGGAYHPWGKLVFAGARLRFMQLHAPWSRGFRARTDNQIALGPEIGVRFSFGARPRVLPFASLGVIFFPSETLSLPPMVSLDIGAAVDLVRGHLP